MITKTGSSEGIKAVLLKRFHRLVKDPVPQSVDHSFEAKGGSILRLLNSPVSISQLLNHCVDWQLGDWMTERDWGPSFMIVRTDED